MTWLAKYSRLLKPGNATPDYLNANRRLQHAHTPQRTRSKRELGCARRH
jgi:hypothetical protein